MSLREWLIAIGSLIIIGVVVDGIRRMHRARKESVAISSGMGADDLDGSPLDENFNPELPNGGARTISRDTLEERGYVKPEKKASSTRPKPTRPVVSAKSTEQEGVAEPVGESFSANRDDSELDVEQGWGATEEDEVDEPATDDGIVGNARVAERRPTESIKSPGKQDAVPSQKTGKAEIPPVVTTEVEEDTARREPPTRKSGQPLAGANRPEAREVVVINVLARNGEEFNGVKLTSLFEACGLEFGDMDIYHRHEESDTNSPVQFSVASAVEPGTFRPEDVPTLATPGISFFMSMPGPSNSLQAFEFMLETAQCVVRNLGGELKDERRSVMTPQTIEHCRQRIREFERKKRSPSR